MSTTYAVTPKAFDVFLERHVERLAADDPDECDGCDDQRAYGYLYGAGRPHCLACIKYHFGHDQATEQLVRSIVGAAVAAALASGASEELVQLAVQDALRERVHVEGDWIW